MQFSVWTVLSIACVSKFVGRNGMHKIDPNRSKESWPCAGLGSSETIERARTHMHAPDRRDCSADQKASSAKGSRVTAELPSSDLELRAGAPPFDLAEAKGYNMSRWWLVELGW